MHMIAAQTLEFTCIALQRMRANPHSAFAKFLQRCARDLVRLTLDHVPFSARSARYPAGLAQVALRK